MTLDQVRRLLLRRAAPFARNKGSTGVRAFCEAHGVAVAHASEFMTGKRHPASDLLAVLGLEWRVMRCGKIRPGKRR